ncbi:MAG: UvrD-helicase domain-containing protein [Candidatus Accumulibacter sp.]|jgi:ATP-dependent helicase/nuclease subunit A|nr:UvrD-helicase domain-containing protein [Accumulibacter sp.]
MSKPLPALIVQALDPNRSVVVEACAGSGKTWLLASRIVRLLLAGVAPGAILAITFTRKAAREIEERVVDWLRQLATGSDAEIAAFLEERGLTPDEALSRAARGLYEAVLTAQPALCVNTFHGWFLQLVSAAPLSANLAGATLAEFDSRLFDELWQSFAAELAKRPESEATRAFVALLGSAGLESARCLMRRSHDRRGEWLALGMAAGKSGAALADCLAATLRERLGAGAPGEALGGFFAEDWESDVQAYLGFLEKDGPRSDQDAAAGLRALLDSGGRNDEALFAGLRAALLTKDDTVRVRKPGATLDKRFTPAGAARFLDLHARLGERIVSVLERQAAERVLSFNRHAYTVFAAFLAHVEAFKRARRQIDFTDAEWQVLRLLRDGDTAAFLQARLDARYRHVLLDEFQDTNPLQWQILRAWFDAYSDAERPRVFMVGDPKQSIYRFRRAEPRLFSVAADLLQHGFGAARCEQDKTRRNARPIIDVVNALFLEQPEFQPFRAQSSLAGGLPGRVELLPLCARAEEEAAPERQGLRNPLTEADVEPEDLRRREEAAALAAKIAGIVGRDAPAWQIDAGSVAGVPVSIPSRRAARYGDFMLLIRSRTHLACYERALAAAEIPFDAGSRGGLLDTLEVRDIVALLEFLVTPADDLKLAQVLRSPLFACGDQDLAALAAAVAERAPGAAWWPCLLVLVEASPAAPRLLRAARLLGDWQRIAGRLPVHDLLDRVYHQGEVLARYRLAVPAAAAPAVEANLRALPLLALDLDGGRYPSLPRFIDALRELREADLSDAPDEGRIETEQAREDDAGRVRILTIHGAKGLEAPIVWLLGANDSPRGANPWDVLVDWPPDDDAPRHFSFYGRKEDRGAAFRELFESEAAAARREELNLLYVALTRARQVFIASGIASGRKSGATPYRLLEAALAKLGSPGVHGDTLPTAALPNDPPPPGKTAAAIAALPAVGERRPEAGDGERFGILLHALLEHRTQGGGGDDDDDGAAWRKTLGFGEDEYRRALPVAERLLAAAHLRRFFAPELYRRAWNEVELADGAGALLRIDRLVEFADGLWVLDYKGSVSDTPRIAGYRTQVAGYCRAVAAMYPGRAVRGALLFADAALVEVEWTQD